MKPTLYEILGVARATTTAEIKSAYRTLAKATHPDVGGEVEAFTLIAKAFEGWQRSAKKASIRRTRLTPGSSRHR
jgi:DnaJ-class molecular chaperone